MHRQGQRKRRRRGGPSSAGTGRGEGSGQAPHLVRQDGPAVEEKSIVGDTSDDGDAAPKGFVQGPRARGVSPYSDAESGKFDRGQRASAYLRGGCEQGRREAQAQFGTERGQQPPPAGTDGPNRLGEKTQGRNGLEGITGLIGAERRLEGG